MTLDDYKNQMLGYQHYVGHCGDFWYDPNIFRIDWSGELCYIGTETDGTKIEVPDGIVDGRVLFYNTQITSVPKLPESLKIAIRMFKNCRELYIARNLPDSIEDATGMFEGCRNLGYIDKLPSGLCNTDDMFYGCKNLRECQDLSYGIKSANYMFTGCVRLQSRPRIPTTCVEHENIFEGCYGLRESI